MFFNLGPYMTWLSIMLTSKPHDLQNRINNLNRPVPESTTASTTVTTTKPWATIPTWDLLICSGREKARYPHSRDCSKYFDCTGESEIVRPLKCPNNLHFSPSARVCTLPQDAGCTIPVTTSKPPGGSTVSEITTPLPTGSSWLRQLQLSNYYKAVDESRIVIYYDHDVANPSSLLWPIAFARTMWDSILMMYGSFGPSNRLYLVLRGKRQSSQLNYASYLDSTKGFVNGIEVGSTNWSTENSTNTDLITLNIAHIVAKASRGIRYPGLEPGWVEIFVYDLYQRVGRPYDMNRWESKINATESSNIASIPIFSQWYLYLYKNYGDGSILNRFFIVREQNFPKASNDTSLFSRTMNRGEFVHFWSGTCGRNFTSLATSVFGWSTALGEQYQKAVMDFSGLSY